MTGTVFVGRGADARALALGKLLGEGASGKVYALPARPGHAAKLYHTPDEARKYDAKIDAMLAAPPALPPLEYRGHSYPQIAWPEAKLYDRAGRFVGFLMPEIDFRRSTSLVNLLQKNSRKAEKLSDYYGYRVLVARNLAAVFVELHGAGHQMIDMKPANLRFYPDVCWMAVVDTDGFSVTGPSRRLFGEQVSDEYIAPEAWQKKPAELGIEQDRFALAVIIFQLLNNGVHPFAGKAERAEGNELPTDLQGRIVAGLYPHAIAPPAGIRPSAASIHRSFLRETRALFDRAFLGNGGDRPGAAQWRDHLEQLVDRLEPCPAKPLEHAHFGAGCGFCGHDARVAAVARSRPVRASAPAQPRTVAGPPRRGVTPPRRMPGRPIPYRPPPPRPRQRHRGVRAVAVLLALGAIYLLHPDQWREAGSRLLAPAFAAAVPLSPLSGGQVESAVPGPVLEEPQRLYTEPRAFLIASDRHGLAVATRLGPSGAAPVSDRLGTREIVHADGESVAPDGRQWIRVARIGDAPAGFVERSELVAAPPIPPPAIAINCAAPFGAAAGMLCADARRRAAYDDIEQGFVQGLRVSEGFIRPYLLERRQAWYDRLALCDEASRMARCIADANRDARSDLGLARISADPVPADPLDTVPATGRGAEL